MAYVIAEPCINVKDAAGVDVCPATAFIPEKTRRRLPPRTSCTSIRSNASIVEPVCPCVRFQPFLHLTICPRSESSTRRSMRTIMHGNDFQTGSYLSCRV